jgi:hypothetical protein
MVKPVCILGNCLHWKQSKVLERDQKFSYLASGGQSLDKWTEFSSKLGWSNLLQPNL